MHGTSVTLGDHFESFIAQQIKTGRYKTASEVMRAALRLLENETRQRQALIQALIEGEESGISNQTPDEIFEEASAEAERDGLL